MPERTRAILARLGKFIGERRRAERHKVRLAIAISLTDDGARKGSRPPQAMEGYTLDLSTSGLALIVPAIRVGDHYLAGESRRLSIKLELPEGPVEIQATPVRYERFGEDESEVGYLIGVKIAGMSAPDRTRYEEYLTTVLKK
jgi:hypothetical protein